jgi:predicted alpha/beta superfamily hydrolase
MKVYLISASFWWAAKEIARNMNLNENEYIYIPLGPPSQRDKAIRGRHNVNPKYLVGYYSNKEWKYLTGRDKT